MIASREATVSVPLIDLAIDQVTVATSLVSGSYAGVSWHISNLGGVVAPGSWTERVGLSTDLEVGNADDIILWSAQAPGPLGPLAGESRGEEIWFPPDLGGSFWLFVQVQPSSSIDEGGQVANNLAFASSALEIQAFDGVVLSGGHIGPFDRTYDGRHVIIQDGVVIMDGQHDLASLLLHQGSTLTHTAASAGGTSLTISGDAFIASDSRIDVNGKGHPYLNGPGCPSFAPNSGGSYGGFGGNVNGALFSTQPAPYPGYGSVLEPRHLGSGGRGASSGGDGGGVVRLDVAGTLRVDGQVLSRGMPLTPAGTVGGGSGGSIWVTAGALEGSGSFDAKGGSGQNFYQYSSGGGGGGRVHLQYQTSSFTGNAAAFGGWGVVSGGAGTVVWEDLTSGTRSLDVVNFDPNIDFRTTATSGWGATELPSNLDAFAEIKVSGGARLTAPRASFGLRLATTGDLIIEQGGMLTLRGFADGEGPGAGGPSSGGGHGGVGSGGTPGPTYDDPTFPLVAGSATIGLLGQQGTAGGAVALEVGGLLWLDGVIDVDGETSASGGSALLIANQLAGAGQIRASGGPLWGTLCGGAIGPGGGGLVALHTNDSSSWLGSVDVTHGGLWNCGNQPGDGQFHMASPIAVALPDLGLIVDGEDFDSFDLLDIGSVPSRAPTDFTGSWGNAGAWGFPPTYDSFRSGDYGSGMRIVDTTGFDQNKDGNSLALNDTPPGGGNFGNIYCSGQWDEVTTWRTGSIVRVEASVWLAPGITGAGIFAVANGRGNNPTAGRPVSDLGPAIEWLDDTSLVVHTAGMAGTQVVQAATTRGVWQRVRMDIDLEHDTFDLWWVEAGAAFDAPLAEDLSFVTPQDRLDRFVIGQEQHAEAYYDDLTIDRAWCRPQVDYLGEARPGTLGDPTITADVSGDVRLTITNSLGAATTGTLEYAEGELPLTTIPSGVPGVPSASGVRRAQPIDIPAGGLTIDWPGTKLQPCGTAPKFLRVHMRDPGAQHGRSFSKWLVIHGL